MKAWSPAACPGGAGTWNILLLQTCSCWIQQFTGSCLVIWSHCQGSQEHTTLAQFILIGMSPLAVPLAIPHLFFLTHPHPQCTRPFSSRLSGLLIFDPANRVSLLPKTRQSEAEDGGIYLQSQRSKDTVSRIMSLRPSWATS